MHGKLHTIRIDPAREARDYLAAHWAHTGGAGGMINREDALWYKDAIIYQVHVKSFFDSDNDGVGDFTRTHRKAGLRQGPWRQRNLGHALLSVALEGRRI